MNCVKELRIKKGIQQKELAISLGVSQPTVSDWESGKKNPKGENLKKLSDFFNVDEQFILGYGMEKPNLFIPENPKLSGVSETDQILQHILNKLDGLPKTEEAKILSAGIDKLPKRKRELAVSLFNLLFAQQEGEENDET